MAHLIHVLHVMTIRSLVVGSVVHITLTTILLMIVIAHLVAHAWSSTIHLELTSLEACLSIGC